MEGLAYESIPGFKTYKSFNKEELKKNFNQQSKIYQNVSIENLQLSQWKLVHNVFYNEPTTFEYLEQLKKEFSCEQIACVGAVSATNPNILILGAVDKLKNILRETFDKYKAIKGENEVYWYNMKGRSFGFSDQEKINLNSPDTEEGEKRLSWLNYNYYGGYRIGNLKVLYNSKDYRKMIWILE